MVIVSAQVEPPEAPEGIAPEVPPEALPNLAPVQRSYERALAAILQLWMGFTTDQTQHVLDQIGLHVSAGDVLALLNVSVSSTEAAAALEQAMLDLGLDAARQVEAEARRQGMEPGAVHAIGPERLDTASAAQVFAEMTVRFLVASAIGETMRVWARGRRAGDVLADVKTHLDSLTDAYPRMVLGGALSKAQRDGRLRTIMGGPEAALYADEVLDKNTCQPCSSINRKWIGNASDPMPPLVYPVAGYIHCRGRWRCRGQVIAVWRGGRDWRKWIEQPPQRYAPEG